MNDVVIEKSLLFGRGDSAYLIVEGPTWKEAEAAANALGGHLVTINDQEENDWLVEKFKDVDLVKDDDRYINHSDIYSIGLTRDSRNDKWSWSSGEDVNFTNFGPNEPYNGQKYAAMNTFNQEQTEAAPDWNWGSVSGSWVDGYADGVTPMTSDGLYGIAEIPLIKREESAYVIVQGNSWGEAQSNSRSLGGNLLTINDEKENIWIHHELGIDKNTLTQSIEDSDLDLY